MIIQSQIIKQFIDDLPPKHKKPLDKIISHMLESSKYIDDSTLIYDENNECKFDKEHYHNWDCNPSQINELKGIKHNKYNEDNDIELTKLLNNLPQNIECTKGDIQLGKRVHACIMMWLSIYIYERPVLYLFRPLNIDKEQLRDDIDGTESWNFNIEWIKNKFDNHIEYDVDKKYHNYKLPSLTDIKDKKVANKLSDKEYLSNPKMIYTALMNPTDLEILNKKFYEYIIEYHEKVNITLIIDESDLLSPTAENSDKISEKDKNNSKSEKLIARLVNKVAHTIHITGTAHSFFWNYTTALSNDNKTVIPIEKVFVMRRDDNYYGFMKKNINFSINYNTLPIISEWWSKGKGITKENKYDVIKDYNCNIKAIISSIVKRQNSYNSFLISEEKVQNYQIKIAENIIKDFHSLFCIVFHGKKGKNGLPTGLRLYFPKQIDNLDIETEIQQVVIEDGGGNGKRLDKIGGLKGKPTSDINKDDIDHYKYYDIDMKSKQFNIKMVYKSLARLFKKIKSNKTVITITGKYGERGYSFTSDYYNVDNKYTLHLTDQYFVSHASYNCTDIFQRARIQGKYTDNPNLMFWTTSELVEIINEYVDFITKVEDKIMSLPRGHEHIRNLCEISLYHKEFVKTLGRPKQRKNLESHPIKYNKNHNAMIYLFPPKLKPEDFEEHFCNWYNEQGIEDIEFTGFVNSLEILDKNKYIIEHGRYKVYTPLIIKYNEIKHIFDREQTKDLDSFLKIKFPELENKKFRQKVNMEIYEDNRWKMIDNAYQNKSIIRFSGFIEPNMYKLFHHKDKDDCFIIYSHEEKELPENDLDILTKKNYKELNDDKILYSKLKYEYINDNYLEYEKCKLKLNKEDIKTINDDSYFFLTADGYVYHHDPDPENSIKKVRIKIKSKTELTRNNEMINPILTFKEECIKEIIGRKRVGVKKVMEGYNIWCKTNNFEEYKSLKNFREEFEKITGLKRSKSNIRGYKIELNV